ncbi:MAG: hypothetical protein H9847_10130 [Candidatus Anaerobiospirillum pullicola]|uniref:Uncharacterized protein n=1 Tax=Candidatus Anaerobiospirillum pullicola TaxID=2838451 RepID=A0A948TIB9_9GAMM|nr:hypothetical protein [Candidatus Anaerobiospirillum pullicola]
MPHTRVSTPLCCAAGQFNFYIVLGVFSTSSVYGNGNGKHVVSSCVVAKVGFAVTCSVKHRES